MSKLIRLTLMALAMMATMMVAMANLSLAAENSQVPESTIATITKRFQLSRPELTIESISASPVASLYAVQIVKGPILYTTADGGHFVLGDLFQVVPGGFVNLAEQGREGGRAQLMAGVDKADMIIFPADQQPAKASVMVFTDVDCFYCQKLHKEVPDLNRIGIEVRYLAYPRAGVGSDSYKKIVSAWCADDRQQALTALKNRQPVVNKQCPGNPVAQQYQLGQQVGVTGTPALVTAQGKLMPGYMPALQLAKALGVEVDAVLTQELTAKQAASAR